MTTYLKKRGQFWYFRRRIPVDCRAAFRSNEILLSLKTRDRRRALDLAPEYIARYDGVFERIRRGQMVDIKELLKNPPLEFESKTIERADGTRETVRRIDTDVIAALKEAGVAPERLAELVAQWNMDKSATIEAEAPSPTITLNTLIDRYNQHRVMEHQDTPGWTPDKGDEIKFRRLCELLGEDKSIDDISREDAIYVKEHLVQLPRQSSGTRGRNIYKVIELTVAKAKAHAKEGEKTTPTYARLSSQQVNNHLTLYSSMFQWAVNNELLARNPFVKILLAKNKKAKNNARRNLFTRPELSTIFSHPIFTDYAAAARSNPKIKPYRYWTPLIGLYTGARPCEISALYVEDIKQVMGVWVFDFNDNTPDKCSKTVNAIRCTPIHPDLIKLGFLDFVQSLTTDRIFDELEYEDDKSRYARYVNERFVEGILKPAGIYVPVKKVFYSFRHTLTTEIQRQDIDGMYREWIMGREAKDKNIGDEFYVKPAEMPKLLSVLSEVDFSEELSKVKPFPTA